MKNFKPSELPVGVVIDDKTEGFYTKELDGAGSAFWGATTYHCVDCVDEYNVPNDKADEFFKDFQITSVPWQTAWELALKLQDEYGKNSDLIWDEDRNEWVAEGEITVEGLIKDAMDETNVIQQEEWEKAQNDS